jgi:hypothetical protein
VNYRLRVSTASLEVARSIYSDFIRHWRVRTELASMIARVPAANLVVNDREMVTPTLGRVTRTANKRPV